jgi:hypothetical protein
MTEIPLNDVELEMDESAYEMYHQARTSKKEISHILIF